METATKTVNPELSIEIEPRKPKARWIPTVVGGLVAVALVVLSNWANFGGSTPVDIGNEYMEARNAFDAERAGSLMSADATLVDAPRMSRTELEQGFEALRVYDAQWEPFECTNKPGTTLVTCEYSLETNLSRIVGYPSVEGSILLLVEEGQITRLVHNFNYDDYAPNVFVKFLTWLGTEHPGAIEEVYVDRDGVTSPNLAPDSLARLSAYIDEYDRFVNG